MTDPTFQARGTFVVSVTPVAAEGDASETALGRMSIAKTFIGDIQGTSTGEMLTAMTNTKGSAVYVAIERVRGSIHGREGTFALYHQGISERGEQRLLIAVVPDSGSGALKGLSGAMALVIAGGVHSYELSFQLPTIADAQDGQ